VNRFSLALIPAAIFGLTALASAQPAAPAKPATPPPAPEAAQPKTEPTLPPEQEAVVQAAKFSQAKPVALELRGLDKMTGRATDIVAPINKPVKFATLTITARTCYSTPPTEPPETTAFLEITDKRPDEKPKKVFSGWMFASTPSINGMEHPLYDVWVIHCRTNEPGVVASVSPVKKEAKPVSPNAGADEAMPELPEDAGQ
jgi:hypothetical protein